jgi:hypothetical protein
LRPYIDPPAHDERRFRATLLLACLTLKALMIAVDAHVRLFMGDSATYLWAAVRAGAPADRSFTYPLFIRLVSLSIGSIDALLWAQSLCGIATAAMAAWLLREVYAVRRPLVLAAALLVAIDPLQLFYERMVMTESLSTCVLLGCLCTAVAYVKSGRPAWIVYCVALGVALASLRVGLVPLAIALGVVVAGFRIGRATRGEICRHVALALALTVAAHVGYQHVYGALTRGPPAYIRDGGLFRLGLVAPLVRAEDFAGTNVDSRMLEEISIPLGDETLREAQIWSPGGFIDVLKRHAGSRAFKVASKIAGRAMRRDPLGVVALGVATTRDYFNAFLRQGRLSSDLGSGQLPDARTLALLRENFNYDADGFARTPTPVYRWFGTTWFWPMWCLFTLAPLSIAAAAMRRNRAAILLALVSAGLVVGQVLCSHIVSFRYLHPFTVLETMTVAVIADALWRRFSSARATRSRLTPLRPVLVEDRGQDQRIGDKTQHEAGSAIVVEIAIGHEQDATECLQPERGGEE